MSKAQESKCLSEAFGEQLKQNPSPLKMQLASLMDKRLVGTFAMLVEVIIKFRHSSHGLLLSELGGHLLSSDKAPAGTKRISNLLRSPKWRYGLIEQFLWVQACFKLDDLEASKDKALVIWDESVWEKPESIAIEGLCAVRSSQAFRLKRIKKGFYNPH